MGAIDRRAFPYALRRLRFADKSKRRGSWASDQVVKEVVAGSYPSFARSSPRELSYLAYVDAVGRAKDEIVNNGGLSLGGGGDGNNNNNREEDAQAVL